MTRSSEPFGSNGSTSSSLGMARRRSTCWRVVSPDLMILDVSMPRVDGLEVCRRLRDTGDRTPVLMLTARDAVEHRVEGLDAGADDYLVKPFALAELKARVRALLRRVDAPGEANGLTLSDLRMDPTTYDVFRGERRSP